MGARGGRLPLALCVGRGGGTRIGPLDVRAERERCCDLWRREMKIRFILNTACKYALCSHTLSTLSHSIIRDCNSRPLGSLPKPAGLRRRSSTLHTATTTPALTPFVSPHTHSVLYPHTLSTSLVPRFLTCRGSTACPRRPTRASSSDDHPPQSARTSHRPSPSRTSGCTSPKCPC